MASTSYNTSNAGGYDMSFLSQLFSAAHDESERRDQKQQQQHHHHQAQNVSATGPFSPAPAPATTNSGQQTSSSSSGDGARSRIESSNVSSLTESSSKTVSSSTSTASSTATDSAISHLPVEVSETDKFIRLRLTLVGVKPSDIKVDVQHGILLIRGVRRVRCPAEEYDGKEGEYVIKNHKFCRRYAIDTDVVDIRKIRANFSSHNILTVTGPKKNAPSSIQVQVTETNSSGSDEDDEEGKVVDEGQYQGKPRQAATQTSKEGSIKKEHLHRPVVDVTPSTSLASHHRQGRGQQSEDVEMENADDNHSSASSYVSSQHRPQQQKGPFRYHQYHHQQPSSISDNSE